MKVKELLNDLLSTGDANDEVFIVLRGGDGIVLNIAEVVPSNVEKVRSRQGEPTRLKITDDADAKSACIIVVSENSQSSEVMI